MSDVHAASIGTGGDTIGFGASDSTLVVDRAIFDDLKSYSDRGALLLTDVVSRRARSEAFVIRRQVAHFERVSIEDASVGIDLSYEADFEALDLRVSGVAPSMSCASEFCGVGVNVGQSAKLNRFVAERCAAAALRIDRHGEIEVANGRLSDNGIGILVPTIRSEAVPEEILFERNGAAIVEYGATQ